MALRAGGKCCAQGRCCDRHASSVPSVPQKMAYTIHEIPVFIVMGVVGKALPWDRRAGDLCWGLVGRGPSPCHGALLLQAPLAGPLEVGLRNVPGLCILQFPLPGSCRGGDGVPWSRVGPMASTVRVPVQGAQDQQWFRVSILF